MTDTPSPVEPDEVPLDLLNEAYRVFLAVAEDTEDDRQALRAAIAVALTGARDRIAGPVLKLADRWDQDAAGYLERCRQLGIPAMAGDYISAAREAQRCATMLRETISRALIGDNPEDAVRACARCRRVLVDRDDAGWYYQAPVTDPDVPGLTFMDRVHECDGQPHEAISRALLGEEARDHG